MAPRIDEEHKSKNGEGDHAPGKVMDVGAVDRDKEGGEEVNEGARNEDPHQETDHHQERNGVIGGWAQPS